MTEAHASLAPVVHPVRHARQRAQGRHHARRTRRGVGRAPRRGRARRRDPVDLARRVRLCPDGRVAVGARHARHPRLGRSLHEPDHACTRRRSAGGLRPRRGNRRRPVPPVTGDGHRCDSGLPVGATAGDTGPRLARCRAHPARARARLRRHTDDRGGVLPTCTRGIGHGGTGAGTADPAAAGLVLRARHAHVGGAHAGPRARADAGRRGTRPCADHAIVVCRQGARAARHGGRGRRRPGRDRSGAHRIG